MNQKQHYRGLFFVLLLGILAISGVSAKEASLSVAPAGKDLVSEWVQLADEAPLLAVQEAFSEFSLPEYSENQFSQGMLFFRRPVVLPFTDNLAIHRGSGSGRDLRAVIRTQIFPFHFFL